MKNYTYLITIPTLNSENTISDCIESVKKQTYKNYSCNIVDSYSRDKTIKIAKRNNIPVKKYDGKLLGARFEGFINESIDYVIFIDSDQILEKTFLERLNTLINRQHADMVILEEKSYKTDTLVEKMYNLDRSIVHKEFEYNISPFNGVLLPRVFVKKLLVKAYKQIDSSLYPVVTAHDHAIIYYECFKISNKISYLKNALFHQEPNSLFKVYKHFAIYGKNTRSFKHLKIYDKLIDKKIDGRNKGLLKNILSKKILTLPLLITKGLGYYYGYLIQK